MDVIDLRPLAVTADRPELPVVLVVCASECNRRGMDSPGVRRLARAVFHEYDGRFQQALLAGPTWAEAMERKAPGCFDLEQLVDDVVALAEAQRARGLVVTHDYPGALLASLAAQRLDLTAPAPAAVVACQHKYLSRTLQRRLIPEATPRFGRLGCGSRDGGPPEQDGPPPVPLPAFAKPVRSNFSFGARRVDSPAELRRHRELCAFPEPYLRPLRRALALTADDPLWSAAPGDLDLRDDGGAGDLLLEEILDGDQVTVEGVVSGGTVHLLGIVDSHFLPGTLCFESFRYPSCLPAEVQDRMFELAARFVRGIGYDDGLFNVEMMYRRDSGAIAVIEVNARMCSQWADLFEKVDGVNGYEHAVRVALGLPVNAPRGGGRYAVAASFPLRSREDLRVGKTPTADELRAAEERIGGVEAYVWAEPGRRLSDLALLQDGESWCYGRVNVAADDDRELEEKLDRFLRELPLELMPARLASTA